MLVHYTTGLFAFFFLGLFIKFWVTIRLFWVVTYKNSKLFLNRMVIENISDPAVIVNAIQPLLGKLSIIVGGIFGLYIILIFIRIYYERKKVRILKDIVYDLDQLNIHFKVNHSKHRLGFFRKIISWWRKPQ